MKKRNPKTAFLCLLALWLSGGAFAQQIRYKQVNYEFEKGGGFSWLEITAAPNPLIRQALEQQMSVYFFGKDHTDRSFAELKKHAGDKVNPMVAGDIDECENIESQHNIGLSEAFGVVSLSLSEGGYACGAHGYYAYVASTFNIATGKVLQLADLFTPGYEEAFKRLGEREVRSENQIPADQSLQEYGYYGFSESFVLASNWTIDAQGIHFVYNPYEVGPWAMPPPYFSLPFDEIKPYIRPDGPLAGALLGSDARVIKGHYSGSIGDKYAIELYVSSDGSSHVGWYYYKSQGENKKINLLGPLTAAGEKVVLTEYINGKANAVFTLQPQAGGNYSGTWKGNKGPALTVTLSKH